MTTSDPRVAAIAALGYAPREAAFLACVARHGGYFVQRQFLAWMQCLKGRTVVTFTRRLVARRHATRHTFCQSAHVYHLASHALYGGAIASSTRERRRRPAAAIKGRLMALDYAVSRPELTFLTTEAERLAYCAAQGIDRACLPQQVVRPYRSAAPATRYFPDPMTVGIRAADGSSPTVICAYIDDGARTLGGFASFLRRHARLLAALPRWQVVYVGETARQTARAHGVFRRSFGHQEDASVALSREGIAEFFELRRLYEAQAWTVLQTAGLDRYLALRARIGTDLDALYPQWQAIGASALEQQRYTAATGDDTRFEAVVLPHRYLAMEAICARA